MPIQRICVYCASSPQADQSFRDAANELGRNLAEADIEIVYGGGSHGSMGALADGALAAGGQVVGILPRFMADLEWGHPGLTRLELVEDMRERKHKMLLHSDAVIALPGGCGTFEELFEAFTLKRLGLYNKPIALLNTNGYFEPTFRMLEHAIEQRFMNPEHGAMWVAADQPHAVLKAIEHAQPWSESARGFAIAR